MEKKMDYLVIVIAVLSLIVIGCSSKIIYGPGGVTEASNYTITELIDQQGKVISRSYVPFVPDRWYSDALDKLGPYIGQILKLFTMSQGVLPVSSAPSQPTVKVKVTPYPAPGRN